LVLQKRQQVFEKKRGIMKEWLLKIFSSDFAPHGYCYLWNPQIVWLHALSDSVIALAYYLIPVTLIYFVRRRRDLPFHWMFIMFGVFIFGCGTTHLMEVWTLWHGTYRLAGIIKALTAIASVATAALLVPLIPQALALPSPAQLRQAEQMAAFGRLAAGMAHEMNTPLGASMTSLKLLHDLVEEYKAATADPDFSAGDHRQLASEMDDFVSATRTWVEKAATHIRSLKLYTAAVQRSEDSHFSVLQTIEDVRLLLSHRFRLSLTKLMVTCSASDPMLYGDAGKLGQVLTNLISNAIDAHKLAGRRDCEIRVEVRDDGDLLEIRVIDQGCGISPEHIDRIFDEFFSTKAFGEGTGLGLSIARNIISRFFEGTIQVQSTLGQGSVFSIRLPSRSPGNPQGKHFVSEE
jgi:two-component system, NtrC family, sensor kinase